MAGGLLDGEAGKGYRVRTEALQAAARPPADATASGAGAEGGGPPGPDAGSPGAQVLRRFIHNGRLLAMPAAHGKRLVVLDHLAGLFEPGRRYPEPEVNELLQRYHPDYAMLRRYLVDDGFLDRTDERAPSGGRSVKVYWDRRHRRGAGAYFFLNRSLASAKVAFRASLRELAAFLVCSPNCGSRMASPRAPNACRATGQLPAGRRRPCAGRPRRGLVGP